MPEEYIGEPITPDVGTKLQLRPEERPVRWTKPRLSRGDYLGRKTYHITLTPTKRAPVFDSESEARAIGLMLQESAQQKEFELLAYCFMPDHLHALVRGTSSRSDLLSFVQRFKQISGFHFKRLTGDALWQQSFFDRVLRRDEDPAAVARYIFDNPIDANLSPGSAAYELRGGTYFDTSTDGAKASSLHFIDPEHGRG